MSNQTISRTTGAGSEKLVRIALPLAVFALAIAAWEAIVAWREIPPYILPAPSLTPACPIESASHE